MVASLWDIHLPVPDAENTSLNPRELISSPVLQIKQLCLVTFLIPHFLLPLWKQLRPAHTSSQLLLHISWALPNAERRTGKEPLSSYAWSAHSSPAPPCSAHRHQPG